MMKTYEISEISSIIGVSERKIYRYLSLFSADFSDYRKRGEKNRILLAAEGLELLKTMVRMKTEKGLSFSELKRAWENRENTSKNEGSPDYWETGENTSNLVRMLLDEKRYFQKKLDEKDREMERMRIEASDQRHRSDTIIMQLTTQLKETRVLLEDLRHQVQEEAVPAYETVGAQAVQDDIMDVDAVGEELVQDVVMEVCDEPPAAAEPARELFDAEEQGSAPVMEAETPLIDPEGQGVAAAAVEEAKPATQGKTLEKPPHPKHSWGVFKRLWVNMFQPELLRESQG